MQLIDTVLLYMPTRKQAAVSKPGASGNSDEFDVASLALRHSQARERKRGADMHWLR